MTEHPFKSGRYFSLFEAGSGTEPRHVKALRHEYLRSQALLLNHYFPNPLRHEKPKVLQMGTSGHATTNTFVEFVHQRNPNSQIVVADLSYYPLLDSLVEGVGQHPHVSFVQADTVELPFPDNTFDWLETDSLMQFLPDRQKAFNEWGRVIKPGGIITTREWMKAADDSDIAPIFHYKREKQIEEFGAPIVIPSQEDVAKELKNAGFAAHIVPTKVYYKSIIATKR